MSKKVKIVIPVAVDDTGYACWVGNNWGDNDKMNIAGAKEKSLKQCRERPPHFFRQDHIVLVEVEVPLPSDVKVE